MLKIKNNVDLKELEKYGFTYDSGYEWQGIKAYVLKCDDYEIEIVDDEDRWIMIHFFGYNIVATLENVLYDLIQAGLVKKVGV